MKSQHLLRLRLPRGERFYVSEFREALAKTNMLPPEFFGYDPDTGRPACNAPIQKPGQNKRAPTAYELAHPSAAPPIRIVGANEWVGILADPNSKDLLHAATHVAMEVVSERFNKPIPVQMETHQLAIAPLQDARPYWAREMVVKKGAYKDMPDRELHGLLKLRIQQGLARQAVDYGMDCPADGQMEIFVAGAERPRGLRIVTSSGATNQYALLLDVKFYANLELLGFWFAGNLTARGYGRIGLNLGEYNTKQRGKPA